MSSEIDDDGGHAFPSSESSISNPKFGMTRRDWLAGLAMQAFLGRERPPVDDEIISDWAYAAADAMIARSKL